MSTNRISFKIVIVVIRTSTENKNVEIGSAISQVGCKTNINTLIGISDSHISLESNLVDKLEDPVIDYESDLPSTRAFVSFSSPQLLKSAL